eukprot:7665362-Heterocapsa_arctica.AAC.1
MDDDDSEEDDDEAEARQTAANELQQEYSDFVPAFPCDGETGSYHGFVPASAGEIGPGPDFVPSFDIADGTGSEVSCDHSIDHAYVPYPAEAYAPPPVTGPTSRGRSASMSGP